MSQSPLWMPSLNALRALEAVGRLGSYQRAAEELHVTSPAVQQLVRALELAIGHPLIESQKRKLNMTEVARVAMPALHQGFSKLAEAVDDMRSYASPRGVKVSVEPSFATAWLMKRIADFQAVHPGIGVFIDASLRKADLDRHDADIALRYRLPISDQYESWRMFEDETIAVFSASLLSGAELDVIRPSLPFIHYESPTGYGVQMDWRGWLKATDIAIDVPPGGLRHSDYYMTLQSAFAGHGITLASRPLVHDALQEGILVDAFGRSVRNGYGYDIVTTKEAQSRPEVAAFIHWLQGAVRDCGYAVSQNR
jgi:LysR family glycine cleavage system transcriptional activator